MAQSKQREGSQKLLKHLIRELPPGFWMVRVSNNRINLIIGLGLRIQLIVWAGQLSPVDCLFIWAHLSIDGLT